jgi:hypothetical protein
MGGGGWKFKRRCFRFSVAGFAALRAAGRRKREFQAKGQRRKGETGWACEGETDGWERGHIVSLRNLILYCKMLMASWLLIVIGCGLIPAMDGRAVYSISDFRKVLLILWQKY